jgi:pimeloyl-ACP methyl ester carboxylesterase
VFEYAAAVGAIIDALDLRIIALVGFSFGTFVAAELAAARPDTVNFLALVNPLGIGERSAAALAIPGRLSALAKEQGLKAGVAAILKELMLHDSDRITAPLIDLIADCVMRTRYETRTLSRQIQMIPLLEKVKQRTMVLMGAEDPYQRHELGERQERVNRALGAKCVTVVDAAAHWLQYERADFFNRAVLDFIDK